MDREGEERLPAAETRKGGREADLVSELTKFGSQQ